ncbi:MAG: sugar phosphate isomerase/epimerase, partial [Bacteroidetes bacterium]
MPTRRTFLSTSALGLAATLLPAAALSPEEEISLHMFSKHLQFLNYDQMAEAARDMGFAGLDLTVRPGGHVAPERVSEELPQAVAAMKKQGLRPHMMTTALTEADESSATVLKEARKAGFSVYRSGWLSYPEHVPVPVSLEKYKGQLTALAALSAESGMQGAYQNHTGNYLGAAIWDLWEVLKDLPPGTLGSQYDIRHATVEGGNAWYQNLRLIA